MRQICRRLVWFALCDNTAPLLFRPLGDGSLTGPDDDPVLIPGDSSIGLAHESITSTEACRSWQQHLGDYEVGTLFPQFGIQEFSPSPEQRGQTALCDFQGHLIEAFTLRTKAGKLGYSRGATIDGPWFFDYTKSFPSLGITAVIAFTGNSMPEENRTVALTELYFTRHPESTLSFDGPKRIAIGELPPILLRECWSHLRQLAGAGPGFDPEWKNKTQV